MKSVLKKINFSLVAACILDIVVVYIVYNEYQLARNGFPSLLDYQNFEPEDWLKLIILTGYFHYSNSFRTTKKKEGCTFWIVFFTLSISLAIFHGTVTDLKYHLPLFNIETIDVSGELTQSNYISSPGESNWVRFRNQIRLKEYPDRVFYLVGRNRLKNDINTVENDNLFLPKGAEVTLKLRKTDYERMLHGKTNPSISYPDDFDRTRLQIYGMTHEERVLFQPRGIQ